MRHPTVVVDAKLHLLAWNSAYRSLLAQAGLMACQAGTCLLDGWAVRAEWCGVLDDGCGRALAGEPAAQRKWLPDDQGGGGWFEITFDPWRGEGGTRQGVLCIWRDVTAPVRAEHEAARQVQELQEALREQAAQAEQLRRRHAAAERALFDLARFPDENPHPVFRVDRRGRVLYANAACRALGDADCWVVGATVRADWAETARRALDVGRLEELETSRDDQTYYLWFQPLVDSGYVNVYSLNVTRLKQVEHALRHLTRDLKRSNEDLDQFASVASHDLQEPLRQVRCYAELIVKRYGASLDEEGRHFLEYVIDGGTRMQEMISGLLTLSRVGSAEIVPETLAAESVVRQALENLALAVREAEAEVTLGPMPTVAGDRNQLVRLFQNLLGNALKFRQADRRVHVEVRACERPDAWIFSVRDNGIGIEPRYAEQVFRVFRRLHVSREFPGTGIGLAVCRRIAERHGGALWLESVPDEGTTFFFRLPKADAAAGRCEPGTR